MIADDKGHKGHLYFGFFVVDKSTCFFHSQNICDDMALYMS